MLDESHKETFHSITLLYDLAISNKKPIVFWIGAGTSAWCNYPLWNELADRVHSKFLKYEPAYDKELTSKFLYNKDYPAFFQVCKETNDNLYSSIISDAFTSRPSTPVYERFITTLKNINPLHILTTNVDECLENNLDNINIVQNSDLEKCIMFLRDQTPFIGKLHGSISMIESIIFTKNDYKKLNEMKKYISLIQHIFCEAIIVFIGYGLGDEYLFRLLLNSREDQSIFGNGPHFAILPDTNYYIPPNVKLIKYNSITSKDHRSAIQVIEEVRNAKIISNKDVKKDITPELKPFESAHLISDIFPPGTWDSSVTLELTSNDEEVKKAIIGNGFITSEFPLTTSVAMHDIIVGLLCFDNVYASLSALSKVHTLLGSEIFWECISSDCLKFIDWKLQVGAIYKTKDSITGGELGHLHAYNNDKSEKTKQQIIRAHLKAVPGKEGVVENQFQLLENNIKTIDSPIEPSIISLVKGLLLRPTMRKLIGMSGGTSINSIPRWIMYPIMRLANVIKVGAACQIFRIASTRLEFGCASLAGPAFASVLGREQADYMASYVVSGHLDTDLGAFVISDPSIIKGILKFRETQAGIAFRKEILNQLSLSQGSEFITSVNAGLKSTIPTAILQKARNQMAELLLHDTSLHVPPAIWNHSDYSKKALSLWKKRSFEELQKYCSDNGISKYSPCPCGSGEKLRFCCEEALKGNKD